MKLLSMIWLLINLLFSPQTPSRPMKVIQKNGMTVQWEYKNSRIFIEMSAPTEGWVTIGFNSSENITGNYLLMGRVVEGRAEVVEHSTLSPGNYQSFEKLKVKNSVADVAGIEKNGNTTLQFSLPKISGNEYAKNLEQGKEYVLLLAYSREDDFQHHSVMRTSVHIQL